MDNNLPTAQDLLEDLYTKKYGSDPIRASMQGRVINHDARASMAWEILKMAKIMDHEGITMHDELVAARKVLLDYLTFGVK